MKLILMLPILMFLTGCMQNEIDVAKTSKSPAAPAASLNQTSSTSGSISGRIKN